jgi:hypothetical protein
MHVQGTPVRFAIPHARKSNAVMDKGKWQIAKWRASGMSV